MILVLEKIRENGTKITRCHLFSWQPNKANLSYYKGHSTIPILFLVGMILTQLVSSNMI